MSEASVTGTTSVAGWCDVYTSSVFQHGFPMAVFEAMRPTLRKVKYPLSVRFEPDAYGFALDIVNYELSRKQARARKDSLAATKNEPREMLKVFLHHSGIDATIVHDFMVTFNTLNNFEYEKRVLLTDFGMSFIANKRVPYLV